MSTQPPLHGVRVVDLTWLLPGPLCTSVLADLGADVIKVERPGDGDYAREMLPGLFRLVNRGKRSAVLDLRRDEDREQLLDVASEADVFVEGFRPGVVDRLGVGYADVRKRNPGVVYASLSGYGQTGPLAHQPAHDINFCAQAGLLAIPSSVKQEAPYRMQLPVSDIAGAMYAAISILAALRQRDASGRGARLDVSLAESALAWGALRWADAPSGDSARWAHVTPANDLFRAADGTWLAFALVEEKFWRAFCAAARAEGLLDAGTTLDADVAPRADAPRAARLAQHDAVAAVVARRPAAFWLEAAHHHDIPITRVATRYEDMALDPHFAARQAWCDAPAGELPLPAFPVKLPGMRRPTAAPKLGADNARVKAGPTRAWEED